uniref:Pleckstrin homology domain containing, family G (with RhoGef domain) member 4 n=1 Tax=Lates calcarifer TaxID=8187 RepID=A0A4W6CVR1_LATCA
MDSESLDRCIQTALSALYPPFQATSSTVLCQVLNVVESCYRGDGLRYLLHFLLPAKQFLQNLQQHACLQYCGLLFRHEGWPLCIHEKVVVQLCPLDQRLLRPGDFYLLVSPGAAPPPPRAHSVSCRSSVTSSPRLLLCSVSAGNHRHVEQQEVSEIALRSLFSMAWLDSVNREREQRGASRLERCVLSTNGDVFRVPWEDLVYPQFISRPRTALKDNKESSVKDGDMLINMSHDLSRDTNSSRQEEVKLLPSSTKTDQSPASSEAEDSEGEYVELTELPLPRFSPQKGSLTQSISLQHRARTGTNTAPTAQTLSAATAHTPHSTHTHSAASAHTPHSTHTHYAASAHTPHSTHTHSAASAHTPHSTHIHSAATTHTPKTTNTHSTRSCVEVSSHTELCSKLIEENLNQDCRPVILTPISPTTSSFAPPEVMGTVCIQSEQQMSQEQTEGLSSESPPAQLEVRPSTGSSSTQPEEPAPTVPLELNQSTQSSQSSFYSVLLSSGALCLPGTRDRSGRALLTVCTWSSVWSNPDCDRPELLRLLLYYTSTLRKEVRELGLTVLVDARRAAPVPALFSALRSLQENTPGSIHTVLLLINKDSSLRLDKPAAPQVEVLSSLKSVQKHVELHQLPAEFGGSFSFSQSSWLSFRSRVEQLTNQCEDVINLLQKTVNILQSTPLPAAAEDAELLLSRYKAVMRSILEDGRLVRLQQEGGASLSRLRREESSISTTEEYRAEVETVSSLYDQVDELLHRLVTLSNSRTQELNFIVDFRNLEQGFTEVRSWLEEVGEVHLKTLDEPEDSLELLNKKQQDFKDFYPTAYDYCKRGEELLGRLERWDDVSSTDLHNYEVKVHSFWAQLQDFSQRVNTTGQNIDRAVRLYRFLDQAYGWALDGMRHLAGISMEECTLPDKCQAVIGCLEDYQRQHPPIPDAHFQEMKAAAGELRGERGLRQWSFAWSKCQETKKMFDRKMELALKTRDSAHRRRSDSALSRTSVSSRKTLSGLWGLRESSSSSSSSSCPPEEDTNTSSPPRHSSSLLPLTFSPITSTCSHHTPQRTPLLQRLFRSASTDESSDHVDISSSSPSIPRLDSSPSFISSSACSSFSTTSSSSSRRQQLRKTQSFDCPSTPEVSRYGPCPRAHSEPVRRGNTGVFIRGLEVSSTEAADHTLCPRTAAHGWAGQGLRTPGTPGTPRTTGSPAADPRPRGSKLRHIVDEMVTTEREYVRSLQYIIHHYFPEMDRADLPQDLRGKRSVVFGNLEKLLDFHSQFFLRELEACWKHPLRVPHCFLRHQEQFGLYALYSKNKPKSDALLLNHGNAFFRRKQVELGDKMDLSSYLLKPIQRMSKYALLLTDLMKEVGVAQEAELVTLQAATNMVKFQLRHGNDLLAMDAIRDCDVNLKEQGQLIRQDEFTVWTGRRKCQRHIFLFEELVLFSKPKKMEGGLDVFIYKHSFKTADVGLTESTGDSGLRFEIWFRRRTSKNQTFILQAATSYVKHAWTSDIARILWTQATRNKEMRLKEMVSMGVGNKPFLDIQPSDAAISDRAVHCIMKSRGARTRASIAVSVFDHSNPFKRGAVTSDPSTSGPSSSSLLGPLNLHMYSQTLSPSPAAESSFITSCIEEDEQEHETSSQPSMTTESSGSSSRCLSGSTGSDSGCVSSHLQETLPEEPSPPSQPSSSTSNKQHLSSQYISAKSAPVIGPATIV